MTTQNIVGAGKLLGEVIFLGDREIVLALEGPGFNEESINDVGNEGIGDGILYGGMHAPDFTAVSKGASGDGIGIRHQFPDRMGEFIGFQFGHGNNLDGSELKIAVETEIDEMRKFLRGSARRGVADIGGIKTNCMRDLNNRFVERVSKQVQVKADYRQQGNGEDDNVLFGHKSSEWTLGLQNYSSQSLTGGKGTKFAAKFAHEPVTNESSKIRTP